MDTVYGQYIGACLVLYRSGKRVFNLCTVKLACGCLDILSMDKLGTDNRNMGKHIVKSSLIGIGSNGGKQLIACRGAVDCKLVKNDFADMEDSHGMLPHVPSFT